MGSNYFHSSKQVDSPSDNEFKEQVRKHIEKINTQTIQCDSKNIEKKNSLPVIELKIAGHTISCLLDSGSSVSLIRDKAFQRFMTDDRIKNLRIDAKIISVTGENLEITNCVSLPIHIGNKQYQQKFYVVKNELSKFYDAIVGYDFLKSGKFSICFDTDMLNSKNAAITIRDALTKAPEINQTTYAYLPKNIVLEPNETRNIELSLDKTIQKGEVVKVFSNLKHRNIKFVNNVCSVENERHINLDVCNFSNETVSINKNTKFCTISSNFDSRNIELIKQLRRNELKRSDFQLDHLDTITKNKLLDLLMEFADIFSKRLYTIGRTEAIQPNLRVDTNNLPSTRPYRVPEALQDEVNRQLKELEEANIIERSDSHISSPLILIKKKNPTCDPNKQKYRLVIDYRKLNAHVKYPRHRLPIIQHLLDKLRGNRMFSTLDLSSSFWQIALKVEDRDYTTFSSPNGNFRYVSLPQGLNASAETFAKLADQMLAPLTDLKISNYIDDFAIGSRTVEEMLSKLRQLFERFRLFGITINPEKCSFIKTEIDFLGHKLNSNGIRPIDDNIIKIRDFPTPNTVRKIRRFVGLLSYYRKFIKNFSELSAPLTDLTRKNARFRWTNEAQTSFETLKKCLSKPPILIHPDFQKDFVLSTDASNNALGGMLGQKDNEGIIRPIAYFSKKLNNTQKRYTILEKELMAIVCGVATFKHYLYGRHFIIKCDNKALTEMSHLESPGNRVTRWFAFLADYNYSFDHIPSSENIVADALSRDFFVNSTSKTNNDTITYQPGQNKNSLESHSKNELSKINSDNEYIDMNKNETDNNYLQTGKIPGFENLGNSCFMNVVLQSLNSLQPLTHYLTYETLNCIDSTFCMICLYKKHLNSLRTNKDKIIRPVEIHDNLENIAKQFRKFYQADAHEFLSQILHKLDKSTLNHRDEFNLIKENTFNPIKSIFEGNFRNQIQCLTCNKKSFTFETFMDISLAITQNICSLEDALQNFTKFEHLNDSYRCCNCKNYAKAIKQISISKCPEIITFHLKRFEFSNQNNNKLTNFISYPINLNLRPYVTNVIDNDMLQYNLNAIIVHSGTSTNNGHYYCYVKDPKENWYLINDSEVQQISPQEILKDEAYILIYSKADTNNQITNLKNLIINAIQIDLPTVQEVKAEQRKDTELSKIILELENNPKQLSQKYPNYLLKDGLLLHKAFIPRIRKSRMVEQLVIPRIFIPHVLTAKHISHFGVIKTYNAIREKYFWKNLYSDTKNFVESCKICVSFKSPNKIAPAPIQPHYFPSRVAEFISGDYIGPFNKTDKGNKYILTFVDHFSKFIKLYAVPNTTTYYTAECFMDYISTFGVPNKYLTDKASCFTAEVFKYLCDRFGVTKLVTTPQHASCNGQAENVNSNIKKSLAIFADQTSNFDEFISYYALIYNNNVHVTTGEKPSFLQFGYDQVLPTDILNEHQSVEHVSHQNYVEKRTAQLKYVNRKVKENIIKATKRNRDYQHQFAKPRYFSPGQNVFLNNRDCDRFKVTTKRRYNVGPYKIKEKHNEVNFTIVDPNNINEKGIKVHAQRLIPIADRRQHLNLFESMVKQSQRVSSFPDIFEKPHAQFDDTPHEGIPWTIHSKSPLQQEGRNTPPSSPTPPLSPLSTSPSHDQSLRDTDSTPPTTANVDNFHASPVVSEEDDSQKTITYDTSALSPQTHEYNLRDIQPRYLANRFLDWAFEITD